MCVCVEWKESLEKEGRGSRKEKVLVRELKVSGLNQSCTRHLCNQPLKCTQLVFVFVCVCVCVEWKESPEEEGGDSRKEKVLVREFQNI